HEDRASAARAVTAMAEGLGDPRAFAEAAGRAAVAGQSAAEAAVDMALHDLAGLRLGAPLYELFGLDPRRAPETSFTLGLDAPCAGAARSRSMPTRACTGRRTSRAWSAPSTASTSS